MWIFIGKIIIIESHRFTSQKYGFGASQFEVVFSAAGLTACETTENVKAANC